MDDRRRHLTILLAALAVACLGGRIARDHAAARRARRRAVAALDRARDPVRLDLNRAPAAELALIPGLGPALARRIVAYRERVRAFTSTRDLLLIPGVGPRLWQRLAPHLEVRSREVPDPNR